MDEIIKNKNTYIQYDSNNLKNFTDKLFNVDYIAKEGLIKSTIDGRGKTIEFEHENNKYFLKHYIRGGLVRKITYDKYIFNTLASTRPVREYNFLNDMNSKGLPVPKAVALKVTNSRFTYIADLITCKIENEGTLFDFVKNKKMSNNLWDKLSITLEKFFNENVFHSDLNSKNIIIDKNNNIFLLDFDNSHYFYNKKLFNKSIYRLERSLKKIDNYNNEFKLTIEKLSNL
jgi:3-deoxy-D-manno-octulosonic acid kinase